jgi:hypothetical protein
MANSNEDRKWLYFEIMDRAHMLCAQIDTAFTDHPGLDQEHADLVEEAAELIGELYQWAGAKLAESSKDTN